MTDLHARISALSARKRDLLVARNPLSFSQQRLWLFDQLVPGCSAYNVPLFLHLEGDLGVAALARSLNQIAARHDVLRTTFAAPGGQPLQLIEPSLEVALPLVDLGGIRDPARQVEIRRLADAEMARPFDLTRGPLIRCLLLRTGPLHHVFLGCLHHIVTDGWSLEILSREMVTLYGDYLRGRTPRLPPLPLQYLDFARWQRQTLAGERLERELDYWRQQLTGAPPVLELPTDRPRPPAQSYVGRRWVKPLAPSTSAAVETLTGSSGHTLYQVLLTGFGALMMRLSQQHDFVVGSPVANRTRQEVEPLIGFFLNMLALRLRPAADASFADLLAQVREVTLDAQSHQELPFERIVEDLEPERTLAHAPIFQVVFNLLIGSSPGSTVEGLSLSPVEAEASQSQYDLSVAVMSQESDLLVAYEYGSDFFDDTTVLRWSKAFDRLLAVAAADSARAIGELPLLDAAERHQLVGEWADTRAVLEPGRFLHQLVRRQVERRGDAEAVLDGERSLSYRQLGRRIRELAAVLRDAGVGPGTVVGLYADRSPEMVVALLAVLEAGGAYLPLDPSQPPRRLSLMLEDSGAPLILTSARLREALPPGSARRIVLEEAVAAAPSGVGELAPAVADGSLAYVIYTSGSTGRPKGVRIHHPSAVNFLLSMAERLSFDDSDTLLAVTTLSFDISVLELLLPLAVGGRVVVCDAETAADGLRLRDRLSTSGATVMQATPATWQMLLDAGWQGDGELRILCGGEALMPALAERLRQRGKQLWNLYGPTETTVWSAIHRLAGEDEAVPLGRALANTRLAVLGPQLEPLPIGIHGELLIGGLGLSSGYWRKSALTAERFIPDPLSGEPGQRFYRTGDLVRWRADGTLEFLGRMDHQIKLRGFRIELGEIEEALALCRGLSEQAVALRRSAAGDPWLVAYVVGGDGMTPDLEEVRGFLAERLPNYMLPSAVMELDALPRTASGKVDRKALPDPTTTGTAEVYVAPRTPVEETLCGIWQEILGLERVGVESSLFALGGHSLTATRIIHRIRETFRVSLPLPQVFEMPTIAGLAAAIGRLRADPTAGAGLELPQITPDPKNRYQPFPLNDVQQAYWIGRSAALELGNVGSHIYSERQMPAPDSERFNRALRRLIDRHDMLRAVVLPDGRQQILERVPPYEVAELDLRARPPAEVEEALAAVRREMSHQVMPADRWPLFDLRLARLDGGRARLYLSFDLLIADAWSIGILFREMFHLHEDPELELEPLALSFRDCVLAEEALRRTDLYRRAEEYWRRRVDALPPAPELPLATSPAAIARPRFVRRRAHLEAAVWDQLRTRATAAGLSPSGLLLAAFSEVLARWSKSPRFTLNLTLFNRPPLHPQINEVMGDFTTLTLMGIDTARPGSFELRARAVQEQLWQDLEHRQVGGVRVLRQLARSRGRGAAPMMPVVFTSLLIGEAGEQDEETKKETEAEAASYGVSQTPQVWLDHQVAERAGRLSFNWDAVEDLFPAGLLDVMFETYCDLLHRLADGEEAWRTTARLPLPASALAARAEANATSAPEPRGLLHEGFVEQARRRPEQTAVITPERRLSYAELARRADHLAAMLQQRGVGPNQLVAVVMEKDWHQVVAVVGILRAGAAYLPVDPALPRERRDHLLRRGEAEIAVTQPWLDRELEWPSGIARLTVADEAPAADARPQPATIQEPDDLAYVIYTSGSTGEPKGVMIDHRAALNTVADINRRFAVGAEDRVLGVSSLSFDLSVWDVFGTLAAGAALVLPESSARRDPGHWLGLIGEHAVTVWNSVPALLEMLVEFSGDQAAELSSLRLALLSGDWIPLALPDRLRQRVPGVEVVSLGGATEAAVWSIFHPIAEVDPAWTSIPYGRPLANQRFHVLDQDLEPRPVWVPGELFIAGTGVARGYWRDQQRTAESFFDHPRTGEYLYRTGDLGRYLPDGTIEFLGREDLQVKIQGHRIELGEIETALAEHPQVRAAVALAVGPERGARRLVACVVPADGGGPDADALRSFLGARLPEPMVPAAFEMLDELPLSATGKVDRKALAERVEPSAAPAVGTVAPRTPLESRLTALLGELLEVERVGIHDSLFDLGGNSLTAIQLLNRLQQELRVEIPLRRLFETPTAAALAQMVDRARLAGSPESVAEIERYAITPDRAGRHRPFPLNDVQQAYWLGRSDAFQLGNVAAHSYNEFDLDDLDVARMERVLERLIERHDMLRAIVGDDGTQQILEQVPPYRMPVLDLGGVSEAQAARGALEVRAEMSHQVLDAGRWPVFDIRVTRLPGGRARLHLSLDILFMDAWSGRLLWREAELFHGDPEAESEPLELSFRDYVLAEAAFADSELFARSRDYWWQRLPELPPAPELPLVANPRDLDRPRFTRRAASLGAAAWGRVKRRAGSLGLTPSGLLLAAFSEVLAAWSKSPRFTLNVTTFNRLPLHPQVNDVVGDFTTLTLLEVDMTRSPESSFELRARAVQEQLWADLEHRFVGGVAVLRQLARERRQSSGALMPVVFTSLLVEAGGRSEEDAPAPEDDGAEVADTGFGISQTPQVWLDHQVAERAGRLVWNWDAVEELFPETVLDQVFAAYHRLLAALADAEDWQLVALPAQPEADLELQRSANDTAGPQPEGLLHEGFEAHAAARPAAEAVTGGGISLSYAELDSRANALARELGSLGCGPGRLVGVVMEKGWQQVVAVVAILKAGGAYLPVDAELPRERRDYLLAKGRVTIALTQPRLEDELEWPSEVRRLPVPDEAPDAAVAPPPCGAQPQDPAYVIFTSGSTGQPKGVAMQHRATLNTIADVNRRFEVTAGDRVLAVSALNFDLSVYDVLGILAAGGTVVMPEPQARRDPARWSELIEDCGVSVWNSVPMLAQMLVEYAENRPGAAAALASLRLVLLSGDWIPLTLPERLRRLCPQARVISLGGATEAAIWSILYPIDRVDPAWTSIPYGRPMTNQRFHVLGPDLEPRPVWVPGELAIAGAGLAAGYFEDEDKTRASFVEHPTSGERLYLTGDLGRWLPDGTIEFLGREDLQVKVQGHRIELGEIEATLEEHAAVEAAVVLAVGEARGPRRLVACVVAAPPAGTSHEPAAGVESWRSLLAAKLPEYMVPAIFVELDRMPLTANGKVDRRALAERVRDQAAQSSFVAPRTPLEERLAAQWAEVLEIERVGVEDRLIDLGGNSLTAIQLLTRVRQQFGVEVPLRRLFENPTIAALAVAIDENSGDVLAEERLERFAATPDPEHRHQPFPLNDVQQAYWVGRSGGWELGEVAAHSYFELDLPAVDLGRLNLVLRRLIDRHGMLRAIILPSGEQQLLAEVPEYRVKITDLRGVGSGEAESGLAAVRGQMSHQVMAADRWPLFDLHASLLPSGVVRLHFSFDIMILDAWSFRILWREAISLYGDPQRALEPLELEFRDYLQAERRFELSRLYQRSRDYWWKRLESLPEAPQLPAALSARSLRRQRFVRRSGGLGAADWRRLKRRAAGRGLTPSGLLLAAFAEVLAVWSRKPCFTINVTTFNRLPVHREVNDILGDFTTLTLVAIDAGPSGSIVDRARAVQQQLWDDLEHRYVSGVRVLRGLAQQRGSAAGVLMPVVFTSLLLDDADERGESGAEAEEDSAGGGTAFGISQTPQVILDHQVAQRRGALLFNWDAVEDLFPPGVLDAMFGAWRDLLAALAAEPEWRRISRPAVSAAHRQLQASANATAGPRPAGLLHEPFLAQAAAAPERPAVIAADRTLSYGELDRWSTALARRLRRAGTGGNQLVAVVMEKGWQQVVAVLAVLKAGAAYLPVEARLPRNRRWHLLEQGEVRLALTQPWLVDDLEWPSQVTPVVVDESAAEDSAAIDEPPAAGPDELAYVIFTSGSTGQPKGVMIEHRAALNTIADINDRFALGPEDRVLALSALGFDLSVYDVFGLLAAGGALVLPSPSGGRDPDHWVDLIARHRVTVWNTVPALMEILLENTSGDDASGEDAGVRLASLRLALLSGDWIPLRQPERIRRRAPAAEVVSLGGATEASIWSIFHPVAEVDATWSSIPYGRPLRNQGFHVLDHELRPRPLWVPGELYISGVGLARGYWRDPVKTVAKFVSHPETGERLYHTGDLGRWLPDGTIEFLGREDFQVKVQGHRIELGEIEAALQQSDGVKAAVVTAVGDHQGQRRLVAYVVRDTAAGEPVAAVAESPAPALLPEVETGDAGAAAAWPGVFRWPALPGQRWRRSKPLSDEIAKLEFKLTEHGLRRTERGQTSIRLLPQRLDEAGRRPFSERRTWREFDPQPLPLAKLGGVLGALWEASGDSLRRRYSAIAGGGVEFCLYVKQGRMTGIAPGIYRYLPEPHRLEVLAPEAVIEPALWTGNLPIFEQAACALFFVAAAEAGEDEGRRAALVAETGAICQLLMEVSPAWGIGFCSIGSVTIEHLAGSELADGSLILLHNMLGGGLPEGAATEPGAAPVAGGERTPEIALERPPGDERGRRQAVAVRGRSEFLEPALSLEALGHFLSCLRQVRLDEFPLPKYRYPSAGGLYPMQVYLYVEPERVEGVAGGVYYYHQRDHVLVLLSPAAAVAEGLGQAVAAAAERRALTLFIVANVAAIAPIYGPLAEEFCIFEAGSMVQLLIDVGAELGIGLTPLPELDAAHLEAACGLKPEHLVLQGMAGGAVAECSCAGAEPAAPAVPAAGESPRPPASPEDAVVQLRHDLGEELPEYMVPSQFIFLDALPLTPNGKIDRNALPGHDPATAPTPEPDARPQSEMERRIAGICEEVVGREQFGLHDNFFTAGCTSLHLVRIRNRLGEELGTQVPIVLFFKYATVASLASALAEAPQRAQEDDARAEQAVREGQRQRQALKRQRELAKRRLGR